MQIRFWKRATPVSEPEETKVSSAGAVASGGISVSNFFSGYEQADRAKRTYIGNPVAFFCINLISKNASQVKLKLVDGNGKVVRGHPISKLLRRPNPHASYASFMEAVAAYALITGNSYVERTKTSSNPVSELWPLRPDRMRVEPGRYNLPARYVYKVRGKEKVWPVNEATGQSDVLHIRQFHPADDHYGMPASDPAGLAIERNTAASRHNHSLLKNGARPTGALFFKPIEVAGKLMAAGKEVIDKARDMLNDQHISDDNAGRPLVFSGDVDWKEMAISPRDMDFHEGKKDSAIDICNAYGVPFILAVPGQSTYNNIAEAELKLWENTVIPLIEKIAGELSHWLIPAYGEEDDDLWLVPDLEAIPALEPRRVKHRESEARLVEAGIITSDEARENLRYAERPPNSVKKVDSTLLKALIEGIDEMGPIPLFRYAADRGLLEPGATLDSFTAGLARGTDDETQEAVDGDDDNA